MSPPRRAFPCERTGPPERTSRLHRDCGHFYQPLRSCERLDDQAGEAGIHASHPLTEDAVDGLAVTDIGQVDVAGDDVVQLRACLAEEELDVVHDLAGLPGRIADRDRLPRMEILRYLSAEVDSASSHDGLAEVVGETLLRIGVSGVKRPDPAMPADDDRLGHVSDSFRKLSGSSRPADCAIRST